MKNIAKSMIMLSLLLTTSLSWSQEHMQRKSPQERAQNQTRWMQKNLALTEDQNKKVYDIILRYAQEADNNATNPPGKQKKRDRQEINRDREADLKAVLTGEQFQKYQAHVQEMKDKMRERRAGMQQEGY